MRTHNQFPILYGRRITNIQEFIDANWAVSRDLLAGKITVKEANAANREAGKILKMFDVAVSARKLGHKVSKQIRNGGAV
jgi:hypothetical protein